MSTVMVPRVEWTLQVKWLKQPWYSDPELEVTVFRSDMDYAVSVEFRRDDAGPYVTGVSIRRHLLAGGWKGERTDVSPRDIQRLPLAKAVKAALAFASIAKKPPLRRKAMAGSFGIGKPVDSRVEEQILYYHVGEDISEHFSPQPAELVAAGRVLVPRGRPQRGNSTKFYRDIADAYRGFAMQGVSPVKVIAARKGVSPNTVHQWVHRARQLGFLEPSPRSR